MNGQRRAVFVRMLSSAVADQAMLSAASFAVGLILIRHTSDLEYGYYILVSNAFLLLTSLQNAFIGPAMVTRVTRLDRSQHGDLIGGLYREQRNLLLSTGGLCLITVLALWSAGLLDEISGPVLVAALVGAIGMLYREYFRIVLLAYRRPRDVLIGDAPYVVLLLAAAWLAAHSPMPAATVVAGTAVAALCGGAIAGRALRRHQAWNPQGARGILREIAPIGMWSVSGAAIHWTFSQGYSFLVAGTLDVAAVAAIAATRLLMMPVNLLSTGIRSLMLPLTASWLHHHGIDTAVRRLAGFAAGLAVAALSYFAIMWLMRDWVFGTVMKKQFEGRDQLLMMWSAIFLLMVIRDQLIMLLIARERFRSLTSLTFVSAVLSIGMSWWGMVHHGQIGALIGMLVGEAINLAGVALLVLRERRVHGQLEPA